ncbi:hypothetical protein G9A89_009563 [Geosiphon pyriformis]|nr:hypothetical protein G9A89_009563 [Geosiphon pyriformis]
MEGDKTLLDEIFWENNSQNSQSSRLPSTDENGNNSSQRGVNRLNSNRRRHSMYSGVENEISPNVISAINNLSVEDNFENDGSSEDITDLSEDENSTLSPSYGSLTLSITSPSSVNGSSSLMPSTLDQPIAPAEQLRTIVVNRPTAQMIETFRLSKSREAMEDEEVLDFIMKPVPQGQKVLCKITRSKDGFGKFYPQYELFVEDSSDQTRTFMLAARKRKKSKSSHYVITTEQLTTSSTIKHIVGKVRSNFLGTAFSIYSHGRNPLKKEPNLANLPVREELGAVVYDPNILGFKGPRKMTVLLTGMTKGGERPEFRPKTEEETLIEKFRSGSHRDILVLHNKSPQWNEETQSYVLNFSGRVTLASVKNFQIVHDNDLDYIIMQFGRVLEDTFTMDFILLVNNLGDQKRLGIEYINSSNTRYQLYHF